MQPLFDEFPSLIIQNYTQGNFSVVHFPHGLGVEEVEQVIEAKDRRIEAKEQVIEAKEQVIEAKDRRIAKLSKIIYALITILIIIAFGQIGRHIESQWGISPAK